MSTLKPCADNVSPNIKLLRGFKRRETDLILAAARVRRFPAKSLMTHQGEPADDNDMDHPWPFLRRSRAVNRPSPYLLSTETVRDSVVLAWDGATIRGLARRFPQLLENAITSAVDYLSWYIAAHAALCSQTARQRLVSVLLGYASSMGERVSGGIEFDISNEELANAANITPYTASRILSEWQRIGAIRKQRGKLFVRSTERLFLRVA